MTGLLNRRSLVRIGGMLWNGAPGPSAISAILLDIDHFKRFNDVHGHIEGDACIRAVSQCIRATVDDAAFVFRFGGEEILVHRTGESSSRCGWTS
ncbi:GGDEF domain-containing protein [Ensifer adhaerens]|uniref:GGDEF domain-containing protein n=1 Tax=Ensifer adhaerens TaxID=106592 RepID=UPI0015C3B542|nr:GGDEF domain-containing protein [Ensifer adhaerens]